jgi:cobalamin biosynthesis Mg chelatase CobN
VLALLALALFPVNAFAGSGETVYETEVPTVTSEPTIEHSSKPPTHHKSPNTGKSESDQKATGSDAETGGSGAESPETDAGLSENEGGGGHKKDHSSEEEESNPSMAGGGNGGNNNSGGSKGGNAPEGSIGESKDLGSTASGQNVAAKSDDGGSSPVVPILIAVVVLAAISIGVVLYRQRKSGQDGPGGRVSSSNAS